MISCSSVSFRGKVFFIKDFLQHDCVNTYEVPMKERITTIIGLVALLWGIEAINWFLDHRLSVYGIEPRSLSGLIGIVASPFLHGSILHLVSNTFPLAILGGLVLVRGTREFVETFIFIAIAGGLGVWLFGRASYHVGASGVIFGLFGYLVARGYYEKSVGSLAVAVVTLFAYSGILWGVLPLMPGVSWEGHLFGLLAGVLGAKLNKED